MSNVRVPSGIGLAIMTFALLIGVISLSSSITSVFNFYGAVSPIDISLSGYLDSVGAAVVSMFGVIMPISLIIISVATLFVFYSRQVFLAVWLWNVFLILNAMIIIYFPLFFVQQGFSYLAGTYYFGLFNVLNELLGISGIIIITMFPLGVILMRWISSKPLLQEGVGGSPASSISSEAIR